MTSPATILQVLPSLESGGVERGTIEITQAIAEAGMKSLVASSGGGLVPLIARAGGEHITLPLQSKNPLTIWRNAHALHRLIVEHGVNLIHARSRAPAWSARLAARRAGIPFVTTFHGIYGLQHRYKRFYNRVMADSDRVIAVSQFVAEHVVAEYGVDPERIRLIPRGVDFAQFDEHKIVPARIRELTVDWLLPDDALPVIFCPGRISPMKGQDVLIEALALMNDVPFLCIIAGKTEHADYRDRLERLIVERGLGNKVRLRDATQAMNEAYTLSEIVVVPSIKPESFGRVAIEAQAMGKLVIATDHGGARETIIANETGYLVPPGDATVLMEALRYGLDRDAATKSAMSSYARQHVRRHFTSDLMKERTIIVYRELLDQAPLKQAT